MTKENCEDLERVNKSPLKIIFGPEYENDYETALIKADLNPPMKYVSKEKIHEMEVRGVEYFKVNLAKTKMLKVSSILFMHMILNAEIKLKENKSRKGKYSESCEMRNKRKPG